MFWTAKKIKHRREPFQAAADTATAKIAVFRVGFTLIELMVVIGIIGVITSVALTAVGKARIHAQNIRFVQSIQQFRNALELYNLTNGTFPYTSDLNWHCVGTGYPNGMCGWVNSNTPASESSELQAMLEPFITLAALDTVPRSVNGEDFVGAVYVCSELSGNVCERAGIEWVLRGSGSNCKIGNAVTIPADENTLCFMNITDNQSS